MARTASVFTRVEPKIKTQAENVLDQLGISMSTAIEIYLRQIALQRKIPFEIKLSDIKEPISYGSLSDEDFDSLMNKSIKSYSDGLSTDFDDFKSKVKQDLKLWMNGK